jgi:hypothetical protein
MTTEKQLTQELQRLGSILDIRLTSYLEWRQRGVSHPRPEVLYIEKSNHLSSMIETLLEIIRVLIVLVGWGEGHWTSAWASRLKRVQDHTGVY